MSGAARPLPDTALCRQCGYALRDLPHPICPECGRPFDPADPATYRLATEGFLRRHYARPPQRWHLYAISVWAALFLLDGSSPGSGLPCLAFTVLFFLFVAIIADYLVRLAFALYDWFNHRQDVQVRMHRRRWRPWLVTPVCIGLMASVLWYPWPVWLRFRLSQPAFERLAKSGSTTNAHQYVGWFLILSVSRHESGIVLFTTGIDFGDEVGIMFRPTSQPTKNPDLYILDSLAPGWYTGGLRW